MNSLNLRISSVKTVENVKKNSEMRTTCLSLPEHYKSSHKSYCVLFENAATIADQVAVVKNIFKNIGSDSDVLQFLADLFFFSPLKHPVRNQIFKLLVTAERLETGGIDESIIIETLVNSIKRLIDETKISAESCLWNLTITSLSGCFENFNCGLKALERSLVITFPFLCNSVQRYLTELSVLSSPSVRNEYYMYVHNSIRLILSCVQEFSIQLKINHIDQMKQINIICKQIINDDEIPMDPKTNSGILMSYIAKIFDKYELFIHEVKLAKNPNEIALCVGIINTFDYNDFVQFPKDIRDICTKIDDIANANATIPNILLCAARSLYQLSRQLLTYDGKTTNNEMSEDTKLILRRLLIFTFCYLEHHIDSIRHICKDLLRNIIALSKRISFKYLLDKIFDACNSNRLSLSMKCIVLLQATSILGSQEIIQNCKNLFTDIFANNLGRDFIVNNLFEGLMSTSHKELQFDEWKNLWISYLLNISIENDSRLPDIEVLIVKAVKCEPKIVEYIIKNETIPISTKLSALWAVRKSGIQMDNFNEIMRNFQCNLLISILSNCDETRIMALRLLVETHKTTELLTFLECEHILLYLEYNSNCQSPATRQKTLALLSKALIRCELNLVKIIKDNQNHSDLITIPLPMKFLTDFITILVRNLFASANFSRRSISLQLLENCIRILINCDINFDNILPNNTVQVLIEQINDSYETNKELAVTILKLIEDKKGYRIFDETTTSGLSLDAIRQLLISVRPSDSVTAAYRLEFFCNKIDHDAFSGYFNETTYCPIYFAAIRWLMNILKEGLRLAKESILNAAKMNPLYGSLFAIKHLLKRLDFQAFSKNIEWRILIAELIVICKELTNVVGPIVNNSSPEGHLPNDFNEISIQYLTTTTTTTLPSSAEYSKDFENCKILSSKNKLNPINMRTTPQMVLLCAWRTVKEISLILGEIVLRSPIQLNKLTENFLITKEQILEIGENFKKLLSETKHRGAFEQAYIGFIKLCTRLWRIELNDLNILPMIWLRELITLITKDEQINEKICSTRRSAGVPFMVQAIISSELQVIGTTKSLHYCMQNLLKLSKNNNNNNNNNDKNISTEARQHSMNILRAIFRCTELNEAVGEFICDGVIYSICGYETNEISEKNAATLLFSSLITRIFGVQRTKDSDNLNIRNKMTGRVFFLRYPKLYDFFLDELKKASTLILNREKSNKLHPLLIILSRLYPSALEGTESNLKLSEFIPYITHCGGCPEMQTRYLAAKSIIAIIPVDTLPVAILRKCADILTSIDNKESINLNVLHGMFLQLLLLIRSHKSPESELIGDISSTIVTFHVKTKTQNAVILKVLLDIFIEILHSVKHLTVSQETIQNLLHFSTEKHLYAGELSYYYPVFRKSLFIYNLHILRLTLPFGAISDFLLSPPITHETIYIEHAETCLNIILLILLRARSITNDIEEFELTECELGFMKVLPDDTLEQLNDELRNSKILLKTLQDVVQRTHFYPECAIKAYAIMSLLENFNSSLENLICESKKHPGDIKSPLTMCVERIVLQNGVDFKTSQLCLEYLIEIAQPWNPDYLRLRASKILAHIAIHFRQAVKKKNFKFIKNFINLMLSLLMDDNYDIRDNTAKIVLNMSGEKLGMDSVVSTMAQRLFLQLMADILNTMNADDDYIIDIFKIIIEIYSTTSFSSSSSSASDNSTEDESISNASTPNTNNNGLEFDLFDKNEANVFAESYKVIADSIVVFQNTFTEHHKVIEIVNSYKIY